MTYTHITYREAIAHLTLFYISTHATSLFHGTFTLGWEIFSMQVFFIHTIVLYMHKKRQNV